MKKLFNKKNLIMILILLAVVVGAFALNGITGEEIVAKSKEFIITSSLEMEETNINSQMAGQVQQLNVKEGDTVTKGQVLAMINSDTINTQKQQAKASVNTIQGQIMSAEIARNLAKENFDRMSTLYGENAISKSTYDSAKAQYEQSEASIVSLKGQLEAANAAIKEVDTYLNKTTIIAPTNGIITDLNVENGELVSTGLPIAVITDTSKPWITCNVMEKDLSKLSLNQQVEIKFQAYPNKVFHGTVSKINKSADFAVKRATNSNGEFDVVAYGVRVDLVDVDQPLYAGMTVVVNFGEERNQTGGEMKYDNN